MADSRPIEYQYMSIMASLINRMGGQLLPGDDHEIKTIEGKLLADEGGLGLGEFMAGGGDTVETDLVRRLGSEGDKQGWIIEFTKTGGKRYEIDNMTGDNSVAQWVENHSAKAAAGQGETGVSAPDGGYKIEDQYDITGARGTVTLFVIDNKATSIYAPDSEKNYNKPGYYINPQTGSDQGRRVDFKKVADAPPPWFQLVQYNEGSKWTDYIKAIPSDRLGDDAASENIKASWDNIGDVHYGIDAKEFDDIEKEYSPKYKKWKRK